jgi:hypothetical protein
MCASIRLHKRILLCQRKTTEILSQLKPERLNTTLLTNSTGCAVVCED